MQSFTRTLQAGMLLGVAIMAGVDEIVFHQILGWHHFYDRATPAIGLLSDGFLHAAELIAMVAVVFLLLDLQRKGRLFVPATWAGFFLGAGSFQLFDGIVSHKVLRLHQIRYDVPLMPYDFLWNLSAVALLLIGAGLWLKAVSQYRRSHGLQEQTRRPDRER